MMSTADAEFQAIRAYLGPMLTGEACEPIVRQVPLALLDQVWPHVCDVISEKVVARSGGRWNMDTIAECLLTAKWQLWAVWDGTYRAVLATELYREAAGPLTARIVFAAGRSADKWTHLIADIESWARDQGAVRLEMMARKGWVRHLADYKMSHVLLEKDLA